MLDDFDAASALERLGSLHLNDSQTPLGSNGDRHANPGEGELGREGCAAFLSEPRFEGLPCVLELNGPEKKDIRLARKLRKEGAAARQGLAARERPPPPNPATRPTASPRTVAPSGKPDPPPPRGFGAAVAAGFADAVGVGVGVAASPVTWNSSRVSNCSGRRPCRPRGRRSR